MTDARNLFIRYLRQKQELGEHDLILPRELLDALRVDPTPSLAPAGNKPIGRTSVATRAPTEATAGLIRQLERISPAPQLPVLSLEALGAVASTCTACRLAETRTTVVFGEGDPNADLVVVGEAPGADEDRLGRPFVGRAGKLLDSLLTSIGFPRERVYICNVLKCRPPKNRNPLPDEVQACSSFLKGQLDFLAPRVILACGTFPAQSLLDTTEPIGRLRGTVHDYGGVPLIPTYHPAALLRNPSWIRPVWEDLQRLRTVLDT